VLAVGDAEFQKKCLGKMQDVAGHGRTVLFVSHNMGAVRKLCSSAITLSNGALTFRGPTTEAISAYLSSAEIASTDAIDLSDKPRRGDAKVRLNRVAFARESGLRPYRLFEDAELRFELSAADAADMAAASVWMLFRGAAGDDVLMVMQKDSPAKFAPSTGASVTATVGMTMTPGRYSVSCGVLGHGGREMHDWIDDAFVVEVDSLFDDGGAFDARLGLVSQRAEWRVGG
jgi:lipopolysaccharide transport system ATP-binding protein